MVRNNRSLTRFRTASVTHPMTDVTPERLGAKHKIGLREALATNILNMVGVGPFITIPLILSAMGGPQAMLGWVLGAGISICDGLVWAELGAAMPGSGGSYRLPSRGAYGPATFGRLMSFLFLSQTVVATPLLTASGAVGFASTRHGHPISACPSLAANRNGDEHLLGFDDSAVSKYPIPADLPCSCP